MIFIVVDAALGVKLTINFGLLLINNFGVRRGVHIYICISIENDFDVGRRIVNRIFFGQDDLGMRRKVDGRLLFAVDNFDVRRRVAICIFVIDYYGKMRENIPWGQNGCRECIN